MNKNIAVVTGTRREFEIFCMENIGDGNTYTHVRDWQHVAGRYFHGYVALGQALHFLNLFTELRHHILEDTKGEAR